ncbi:MAG: TerB family tellurite resistance protein [Vibrionaceae bacterium]|nr:TerB family tellurite resistance protein [Vibrionaceae bacterium]
MINSITKLFKQLLDGNDLGKQSTADPNLAIACLLSEVAGADYQVDEAETKAKFSLLGKLLGLDEAAAQGLLDHAQVARSNSASLYEFTSQLRELSQETRFALIQAMWEVANADGKIDPLEDAVIRKTAELLYVDHSEFIRAKLSVTNPSS